MDSTDLNSGLLMIERAECFELLATEQLGRLAVVVGGLPEIFPVSYAVDGDTITFRSGPGTKLLGATRGPVVFEVDHFDLATRSAWSVIVHGRAQEVSDFDSAVMRQRISQLSLYPAQGSEKQRVLRVVASTVTGRRIPGRADLSRPGGR